MGFMEPNDEVSVDIVDAEGRHDGDVVDIGDGRLSTPLCFRSHFWLQPSSRAPLKQYAMIMNNRTSAHCQWRAV